MRHIKAETILNKINELVNNQGMILDMVYCRPADLELKDTKKELRVLFNKMQYAYEILKEIYEESEGNNGE